MGTDTGTDADISPRSSPQIEMFTKQGDLQGLSSEILPYHTGHIVSCRANITMD